MTFLHLLVSVLTHFDIAANITIISKDGASGDFSGGTDLAYEKAIRDGVDFIDCNVQMSKDKIPFCMSSIDLMNSTNVIYTSFKNLSSTVSEIQQGSSIFTFSLTMSEIQTLKRKKEATKTKNEESINALIMSSFHLQLSFLLLIGCMVYSETQETRTLESFLHYLSSCYFQTVTALSQAA